MKASPSLCLDLTGFQSTARWYVETLNFMEISIPARRGEYAGSVAAAVSELACRGGTTCVTKSIIPHRHRRSTSLRIDCAMQSCSPIVWA